MKDKILVNIPTDEALRARMRAAAPAFEFYFLENSEDYAEVFAEARIVFGKFYPKNLPYPAKLEWAQVVSSGVDRYVVPGALPKNAILTSGTGAYDVIISEFMVAQLLSLSYNLPRYRDHQNNLVWGDLGYPSSIAGKTILLFGLGSIGAAFAKKMKDFGAYVIGVRRSVRAKPDCVDEVYTFDDPALNAQFARADAVAMCVPETPETIHILNDARIRGLKPSAVVINVGRGSAIEQDALIQALKEKRIAGAALDVTTPEPLPKDNPLWTFENVLLTPHIAGHDYAFDVLPKTIETFFYNLEAFQQGRPMRRVIDRTLRYCAVKDE
ncbi:D-2-hydroxyacid dehydrogenase [Christensenellaceae bacterium OttesenSCG-928-L17]|nr:D-2-hydroxyacid dehydrogenase [Christensenellaceae bacterium OttesenSCG-928-L17]